MSSSPGALKTSWEEGLMHVKSVETPSLPVGGLWKLKYPRNLESPRVSSPGFCNDFRMMVMSRCYSTGCPRVTTPNEDRCFAVTSKRNRRIASDLFRQLSSATGTIVSRQTVYRRLGHIGLYAVGLSDVFRLLQLTFACDSPE
ncbi:transposable element Tcb2 transposase [Trichonephila clavipes]|nr:transposable element Tcb2 transposase [Trichonephila clavipes]